MKNVSLFFLACAAMILTAGCASTSTIVSEFDADGKLVKETKTSESIISSVVQSTKEKTVIIWEDGFVGYLSASTGTSEDPTPHGKIFIGKVNKGMISLHKNHNDISGVAAVIMATKSDLSASFTGLKAEGAKTAEPSKAVSVEAKP